MGVVANKEHILGRKQKAFFKAETTAGTFLKPVAADALKVQTTAMKHVEASEPIDDNNDLRYHVETIQDKTENTWSADGYLLPSGVAANECRVGPIINAAMGANNSGAASTWIYTIPNVQIFPTLSIVRHWQEIWQQTMWGCWVDSMTFKLAGGAQPTWSASGGAMGYAFTGKSTLDAAMAANTMTVQPADIWMYNVGSVVHIDTTTSDTIDREVTAVLNRAAGTFTVDGAAITEADDDAVIPYIPAPSYLGSPISGVLGSIQVASVAHPIQDFEVKIDNNHDIFRDEAFQKDVNDFATDKVAVSVTIGLRAREDLIRYAMANPHGFAQTDIAIVCGDTAGFRFNFDIDRGEAMFPDVTIPKDKAGTIKLTFNGLGTGTGPVGPLIITTD